MKAYKVVERRNGKLISAALGFRGEVVYRAREWVSPFPGNGPLSAFEEKEQAIEFLLSFPPNSKRMEIWEAEVEPWLDGLPISQINGKPMRKALWIDGGRISVPLHHLPKGTILCKRIKLLFPI